MADAAVPDKSVKQPPKVGPSGTSSRAGGPAQAMLKLGLVRDIDLALHLPLRYEDETQLTPIGSADPGRLLQVQGRVRDCRVELRPRRQLLVRINDGSGELLLRFLNFYPSQQKALAAGHLVRARGEVRGGFFGL